MLSCLCTVVMITPCLFVVLNICRCTLYYEKSFYRQVYWIELDTLFSLLSTLDVVYNAFIDVARSLSLLFFLRRIGTYKTPPISSKAPPSASTSQPVMLLNLFVKTFLSLFPHPLLPPNRPLVHIYIYLFRKSAGAHGYYTIPKIV